MCLRHICREEDSHLDKGPMTMAFLIHTRHVLGGWQFNGFCRFLRPTQRQAAPPKAAHIITVVTC